MDQINNERNMSKQDHGWKDEQMNKDAAAMKVIAKEAVDSMIRNKTDAEELLGYRLQQATDNLERVQLQIGNVRGIISRLTETDPAHFKDILQIANEVTIAIQLLHELVVEELHKFIEEEETLAITTEDKET